MWNPKLGIKDGFCFDYTQVLGKKRLSVKDLETFTSSLVAASARVRNISFKGVSIGHLSKDGTPEHVYFMRQGILKEGYPNTEASVKALETYGATIKDKADVIIFLGIGGSYLGDKMLFDLFAGPYWNSLPKAKRHGRPRMYFSGNNVDSEALYALHQQLDYLASRKERKSAKQGQEKGSLRVELVVISKSGTTMETLSAFSYFYDTLSKDARFTVSVTAVTGLDEKQSALFRLAQKNGWQSFAIPEGIGGRFCVLSNPGLIIGAALGIDIRALLNGAKEMVDFCFNAPTEGNPALINAGLKFLAQQKLGIDIEVFMGYGDKLKSLCEWYVQLLAESLGKRFNRDGKEINYGRTPIVAVGTTDMHAQTQQHQDGKRNKLVQFLQIKESAHPLTTPSVFAADASCAKYAQRSVPALLDLALAANEEALASDERPSARYILPKMDERNLGQLLMFLMLSIAYEGELAGVDAYDQPGVEAYKRIMQKELGKK